MQNRRIEFSDGQAEAFAIFLSVLVQNGIEYSVRNLIGGWSVILTGDSNEDNSQKRTEH
jgi:hypothetical protein